MDNISSEKENKKVQTDKQFKDNPVRERQGDSSVFNENSNKSAYPARQTEEKDNEEYMNLTAN